MEKENKTNFERYAYATLAAQLSQSEEGKLYLSGATNLLEKNLDFGDDGADLYRGYINDGQISKIINIYSKKFTDKQEEAKLPELYEWYESGLEGTSDEQKALIKAEFDKFAGKTYGKVIEEYLTLKEIADSKTENFSQEQKEKAEKGLKEYEGFLAAQKMCQGYTFEGLRAKAVKESKKENFGNLEKMLKGEVKEE